MRSHFTKKQLSKRNKTDWKVCRTRQSPGLLLSTMTLGKQERKKRNLTQTTEAEKLHFLNRRETNLEQLRNFLYVMGKLDIIMKL